MPKSKVVLAVCPIIYFNTLLVIDYQSLSDAGTDNSLSINDL